MVHQRFLGTSLPDERGFATQTSPDCNGVGQLPVTDPPAKAGFHWALPRGLDVEPDVLQLRLDFYLDTILLTDMRGGVSTVKPVSARDIVQALTRDVAVQTGVLPPDALWWRNGPTGATVAFWQPPQVRILALLEHAGQEPLRCEVPLPGMVFACQPARAPWVWAAKHRPTGPEALLYHAPLFNVFRDGRTCPGTQRYSPAVEQIPFEFWVSFFTGEADHTERSRAYPKSLKALWQSLEGAKRYPPDDLVQWGAVKSAMEVAR